MAAPPRPVKLAQRVQFSQNPGLKIWQYWTFETEAMAREDTGWLRTLVMDLWQIPNGHCDSVCRPYAATPVDVCPEGPY